MENLFNIIKATAIAERTSNAYKYSHYGQRRWIECISFLLEQGVAEEHVEWIVRSKHMRWSADRVDDVDEDLVEGFKEYFNEGVNSILFDANGRYHECHE